VWVVSATVVATLVCGVIAIGASLLRFRGRIYYLMTRAWARVILRASGTPVVTTGMERIDWSQPHVLVANHVSDYDILALAGALPVPYAFVAKKELERVPFFGTAWKAAGHISIDRSDREKAVQSLHQAGAKMREERTIVIIFPEGTRSRTGELQPFKKGAFVLAIEAHVPILPVAIRGSTHIRPPGSVRIEPRPIHLHFLEPIPPPAHSHHGVETLMAEVRRVLVSALARPG
jgi:1-acyl-sn-glycerol-3-phosphate acyltransferase